jgi:uncharacterized protein
MKRYRDFNTYLREIYGCRVHKIALDAGLTCPNRDGTISDKGCIFCDARGSGTGAFSRHGRSLDDQIMQGRHLLRKRYGAKKFIAYFQSFSNTYGSLPHLKALYDRALSHEDMVGLSVATRPDCVDPERLRLLQSYREKCPVWIEYGLQSAHEETLRRIHRGHDLSCFEEGVRRARDRGLNICTHVILGLPGENRKMMLETAGYLSELPIQGIKIHLLYVLEGTAVAELYRRGEYRCLEREEYAHLVVDFLEHLPSRLVIQRLTGDPPSSELLAPGWAEKKTENLRLIRELLEKRDTWQGRLRGEHPSQIS